MATLLQFHQVSFAYDGMTEPLLHGLTAQFGEGWTGIVGPNGAGKTTLLRLAAGELAPSDGTIRRPGQSLYAVQRTDDPPPGWEAFLLSAEPADAEWRRVLGIVPEWAGRWQTLSHGERKRLQIAVALAGGPAVLALDEPTNHVDAEARATLLRALRAYRGTGLLVSHDRELLDALCRQCLFLTPPTFAMRPGGVTAGLEQDRAEQTRARDRDDTLKHAAQRLNTSAQRMRERTERMAADNRVARSRKIPAHDHDGRAKRNLAKLTGKDAWGGSRSAALARRAGKTEGERKGLAIRKEYEMGFWLEGSGCSPRNRLLMLPAGEIPLGVGRRLVFPPLEIAPTDRIALTGANGRGKSTLVSHLLPLLQLPPERLIYIPQEISALESRRLLESVRALPPDERGRIMTCFSRLGSRPGRLLASEQPSPGEVRKLLLALGVSRGPHLLLLDEPTNHMDLPSIECLEEALAECPCAMLLVSHDVRFLARLTRTHWHVADTPDSPAQCRLAVVPAR